MYRYFRMSPQTDIYEFSIRIGLRNGFEIDRIS